MQQRQQVSRWAGVVLVLGVVASGCGDPDRAIAPGGQSGVSDEKPAFMTVDEEELFGNLYVNGTKTGGAVTLTPDATTLGRLNASHFLSEITASDGYAQGYMYGWFDPAGTDGGCVGDNMTSQVNQVKGYLGVGGYTRTLDSERQEVHPINASAYEDHCIRPGRYTLTASAGVYGATLPIDYLALAAVSAGGGGPILIPISGGGNETIEPLTITQYGEYLHYTDFVAHFDFGSTTSYSESPVLQVQNAGASPHSTGLTFADASNPSGSSSDYFRFRVNPSTSTWSGSGTPFAAILSRLFWDYGVDPSLRTGYYDAHTDYGPIRLHQFTGISSRCVIVGYELKRPDEDTTGIADRTKGIGIGTTCPNLQDLMPMPVSMSATSVNAGQPVTVKFRQHNVGTQNSGATWTGKIYLSTDATCCSGDVDIGTYTNSSAITAGSYSDKSLAVTIPANTLTGNYYVFSFLDAGAAQTEGDENNNKRAQPQLLAVNGVLRVLSINAGNGQSATVNTNVAVAPSVLVTRAGSPESGVPVTFTVSGGGGSVVPVGGVVNTNGSGIATLTSWKLGTTAGANGLSANAPSSTGAVSFTATGTAGTATAIIINGGNNQTAVKGTTLPIDPSARVNDTFGNPVSGRSVTFAVASGGGSITGGSQTTNASGIATVTSWTLGPNAGSNTLSATSAGLTGSPLTFTATGINFNPPTAVTNPACSTYVAGSGKTYVDYTISWTAGSGNPIGTGFEIGENTTSNPAGAGIVASGTTATSHVVGSYLVQAGTSPRYIWVRHTYAGTVTAWAALSTNPLQPEDGCLN